jgi:hypothetical protein
MRITIEIPEPRFKVGDIIKYEREGYFIYAKIIGSWLCGTWSIGLNTKQYMSQEVGEYVYKCLEFCIDAIGGIIPEGTILTEEITNLDKWVY